MESKYTYEIIKEYKELTKEMAGSKAIEHLSNKHGVRFTLSGIMHHINDKYAVYNIHKGCVVSRTNEKRLMNNFEKLRHRVEYMKRHIKEGDIVKVKSEKSNGRIVVGRVLSKSTRFIVIQISNARESVHYQDIISFKPIKG